MRVRSSAAVTLAAMVAMGTASACEPLLPRVAITVNSFASGTDHAPGDGACEVNPGVGDCTLEAAIDEANAVPRAAIAAPAGTYPGADLLVTGDVTLNWEQPEAVVLGDTTITVADGASLAAEGLQTRVPDDIADVGYVSHPVRITVAGSLQLRRSTIVAFDLDNPDAGPALTVTPTGGALIDTSVLVGFSSAVDNARAAVFQQSSLFALIGSTVSTSPGAQSVFRLTAVDTVPSSVRVQFSCSGPSTSLGYNGRDRLGCDFSDPTDLELVQGYGFDLVTSQVITGAGVALVDAVPIGQAGCTETSTDLLGNLRGNDGNGDGISGCDIGAVEYQP